MTCRLRGILKLIIDMFYGFGPFLYEIIFFRVIYTYDDSFEKQFDPLFDEYVMAKAKFDVSLY